jgi:prepilin-type N-terminal cleavage/methylation domain-containing protein
MEKKGFILLENFKGDEKFFLIGFTLIEVMVVMMIIAVLVAILIPAMGAMVDKARVTQTLRVIENLRDACNMYYEDMGSFPREYEIGYNPSATSQHQLTYDQGGDWNGPYLDTPYKRADSPFAGWTGIYRPLTSWPSAPGGYGFDLNGDGSDETAGDGSLVRLDGCSQSVARKVNDIIDEGIPGTWTGTGKVEFGWGNRLVIYLSGER